MLTILGFLWFALTPAAAAPYAAMVIDARSGEVLHSRNADTRLHPASLTKMMTLYVAFEAVQNGELSMDTKVRISKKAASEPPSKLGLKAGQRIALRYLVRAAAVKSANDAATAIGEAISGSEAAFARRMNRTAKALGMTNTTFKNAHGLTESGHLSTARDMTRMGRHLLYDYPQYYNLFSRKSTHAGLREVANTNRRFLGNYRGADGIKTGYTRAAGFNLVASAERGQERIIATVFGGRSTATRNARVAELLDLGFRRAPSRVALRKPTRPAYAGNAGISGDGVQTASKTVRVATAVNKSLRPRVRPTVAKPAPVVTIASGTEINNDIENALRQAQSNTASLFPSSLKATDVTPQPAIAEVEAPVETALVIEPEPIEDLQPQVVTRLSTSGGHHWGINVGRYPSRYAAEKTLLKTALAEMSTLEGSLRKVVKSPRGFDANFMGLTREGADLACRRLKARQISCFMIGPS
ncbi:D-alanyl-D-alanine carboxypeptidase [Cognatishimia sp. SS12]|nr:D-alanyl-D-alanine carboxypeptidase family protein [Cognatishimia sp. SS12]MDC0739132.1 D-alanyl-D-alanine carboxypeptidase [Cognatishimia sp. SS12]